MWFALPNAYNGLLFGIGGAFLLVGLLLRWQHTSYLRHVVTRTARVVDKRMERNPRDDGGLELYFLACVFYESGRPISSVVQVEVTNRAWFNTKIDDEIELLHGKGKFNEARHPSRGRSSDVYFFILMGLALLAVGGYGIAHDVLQPLMRW